MLGHKIMVLGPSGGGKSASMRGLDPRTTALISPDRKKLPLEGAAKNYITVLKPDGRPDYTKSNFIEPSFPQSTLDAFAAFELREDIVTIAVDTVTHMITADYVQNAIGKEFKDYQKMGKRFYDLTDLIRDSQKNVVIYAHSIMDFNEVGDKVLKMNSPGKMIEGFTPPSFFTTVLHTHMERKENKNYFYFRTQPEHRNDPVKNPARFRGEEATNALNFLEPNNIQVIFDKLEAFDLGIEYLPPAVAQTGSITV